MGNFIRCFIAIELCEAIKNLAQNIQKDFKKLDCDIKWVEPKNIHLTLKFLGDVGISKIDSIIASIKQTLENSSAFSTETAAIGAFPKINYPKVIWLGLKDEQKFIEGIYLSLENSLHEIGFSKEERGFSPHITIGRVRSNRNINLLSQKIIGYKAPEPIIQPINNVTLFKSTLTSNGPIYEILNVIKLIQT